MSLQFTLTFVILLIELGFFAFLLIPLPTGIRKVILRLLSTSNENVKLTLRILFVFISILFLDSINRAFKQDDHEPDFHHNHHAKENLFRAQRNMYLTGFTLLLALIINRFIAMIQQTIDLEEQIIALNERIVQISKKSDVVQLENLKKELEEAIKKGKDMEIVVKQANAQHDEYMRLADRYNELEKKLERSSVDNKKDK